MLPDRVPFLLVLRDVLEEGWRVEVSVLGLQFDYLPAGSATGCRVTLTFNDITDRRFRAIDDWTAANALFRDAQDAVLRICEDGSAE